MSDKETKEIGPDLSAVREAMARLLCLWSGNDPEYVWNNVGYSARMTEIKLGVMAKVDALLALTWPDGTPMLKINRRAK
jgi:hypothetical protein